MKPSIVFIARLGSRSKKNRDLLQTLQKEADRIGKAFWLFEAAHPKG